MVLSQSIKTATRDSACDAGFIMIAPFFEPNHRGQETLGLVFTRLAVACDGLASLMLLSSRKKTAEAGNPEGRASGRKKHGGRAASGMALGF